LKKLILVSSLVCGLITSSFYAKAQEKEAPAPKKRCGTMEYYNYKFATDPEFKAQFEANQQKILNAYKSLPASSKSAAGLIKDTIPVVIHVIGTATMQSQATDAIMQSQIDVLTEDYQGKNADSTRIPAAFKPLFGKTEIVFMLAQTAPDGSPTNGIERRVSSTTYSSGTADNAKQTALGGMNAWDPLKYLNLWVVSFGNTGLLGISVFPGDPKPINLHGFVCDYRAFGRGASYLYAEYNKGRTTSHELGHFWNLRHIWGDDGGACTGSDFPGSPAGWDDTPNQGPETYGNPDAPGTGTVLTDACSPSAPGIMYQNYMDYTDDIALVMFTKGQWMRMEQTLTTAPDRAPLLNSNTYNPPVPQFANDASVKAILAPADGTAFCTSTASITPSITLRNTGSATLTNVKLNVKVDNNAAIVTPWTGSLATFGTVNVNLPSVSLTAGAHTVKIYTSEPNNVADQYVANDTLKITVVVGGVNVLPVVQGFEAAVFPGNGWTVKDPDADGYSWQLATNARKSGSNSAMMPFYDYSSLNRLDYLVSPLIDATTYSDVNISFYHAYKRYTTTGTNYQDTLEVVVSTDCGTTWTSLWKKGGADLATATGATGNVAFVPTASQWSTTPVVVNLSAYKSAPFYVALRSKNRYGQYLYVDDINIYGTQAVLNDAGVTAQSGISDETCSTTLTPSVTVKNFGQANLTSVKVSYVLDNGVPITKDVTGISVPQNGTTTVTFNAINDVPATQHTIKFYTSQPNGVTDQQFSNDTIKKSFVIVNTVAAPLTEGFEDATFPPANWVVKQQPIDAITWARNTTAKASTGVASAYMNNYNYGFTGRVDELVSPNIQYAADSIFIRFDVSAVTKSYPGSTAIPLDTLEVAVSTDCGASYTTVYKKFGYQLQTVSNPNTGYLSGPFVPNNINQWRTDSINVTAWLGTANTFRMKFKNTENNENNIYVDNVNVYTKTMSTHLKTYGLQLAPNPVKNVLTIRHLNAPTNLRGIGFYNAIGERVMYTSYNGMADSYIPIDISRLAAGVYMVKLEYTDHTSVERIIKQ